MGNFPITKIIGWTNYYRKKAGLDPVSRNHQLESAAKAKATDMVAGSYFAHTSPSGVTIEDVINNSGYKWLDFSENLAFSNGWEVARDIVDQWMASPPHKANILNPVFKEIGVSVKYGYYPDTNGWFAVQEFGNPDGSTVMFDGQDGTFMWYNEDGVLVYGLFLKHLPKITDSQYREMCPDVADIPVPKPCVIKKIENPPPPPVPILYETTVDVDNKLGLNIAVALKKYSGPCAEVTYKIGIQPLKFPPFVIYDFTGTWRSVITNDIYELYNDDSYSGGVIVWDYKKEELLQVPKIGGEPDEFWQYPVSFNDRQVFLWNLRDTYNKAYVGGYDQLFSEKYSPEILTNGTPPPTILGTPFTHDYPFERGLPKPWPDQVAGGMDYFFGMYEYGYNVECSYWGDVSEWTDPDHIIPEPPDGTDQDVHTSVDDDDMGTIANNYGYLDTFNWEETITQDNINTLRWDFQYIPFDQNPRCGRWASQGTIGPYSGIVNHTVTSSFSGDSGGFPDNWFTGGQTFSAVPSPALKVFPTAYSIDNDSVISITVLCSSIEYLGTDYREEGVSILDDVILSDGAIRTGSYEGTLTSYIDNAEYWTVSGTHTLSYDNVAKEGETIIPTSFPENRFALSTIYASGVYDNEDKNGLILTGIVESIYTNNYSYTDENGLIYLQEDQEFITKFVITNVEDATTQNPLVLDEDVIVQEALKPFLDAWLTEKPEEGYYLDLKLNTQGFSYPDPS